MLTDSHTATWSEDLQLEDEVAARAGQPRASHPAVRDRRGPARWWQRWLRRLPDRRAGLWPAAGVRTGVGAQQPAAERADAARAARLEHQLFAAGLHHLR